MTKADSWNADLYNDKHGFVHQYGTQLVDLLHPKKGESILDLGCGSGQLTAKIAESGASVIGIDSSNQMIASARKLFPDQHFYVKDATDFSFKTPFDAIFSNAVLHWVKDQKSVADCMYKNLKEGGRLVLEFGGKGNVDSIIRAAKKCLISRGLEKYASIDQWYFPSISEYTNLLESSGFEVSLAQLYDRPTRLESDRRGIKDWLEMFGAHFFDQLSSELKEDILEEVQEDLRTSCFKDGHWYADYRRIRIVAHKC